MNLREKLFLTGLFLLHFVGTQAQSKGYMIGDVVADFQLKHVNGQTVGLPDYRTQKGLIVVFTSNHCPFAKAYENRIQELDRRYAAQGFPVLAIMPNDPTVYEDDSFEAMKVRAAEKAYSFAYAIDETQTTARAFGATRTPQVFVLKNANSQFVLEYVGAIDDNPQDTTGIQRRYVEEAVNYLLEGRPVQSPITKPIGCAIKWR